MAQYFFTKSNCSKSLSKSAVRDLRRTHSLPHSPFIQSLTQMIALRCKRPGEAGLSPELLVDEVQSFIVPPIENSVQDLGEDQWWSILRTGECAMSNI